MDPYRQVVLAARPKGLPRAGDFRLETGPMPEPLEGQVLVATRFLSLDPYMRGRMNDAESYAPPVNVGGVMEGEVVAEVVRSRHPSFSRGELVQGRIGWRTHAAVAPRNLRRVETGLNPPETSLGVLGMPGFTAYAGLQAIGQPKPGETVVVSSAAGAVGSLVGQLAQLAAARAVGIAGARQSAPMYVMSSDSMPSSTTRPVASQRRSRPHAPTESMSTSRMSADRSGMWSCRS